MTCPMVPRLVSKVCKPLQGAQLVYQLCYGYERRDPLIRLELDKWFMDGLDGSDMIIIDDDVIPYCLC